MKKIVSWLAWSSEDITKISLTLKAGVPFLALLGLGKFVSPGDASSLIDIGTTLLLGAGQWISGAIAFYGLMRKVVNSVKQA